MLVRISIATSCLVSNLASGKKATAFIRGATWLYSSRRKFAVIYSLKVKFTPSYMPTCVTKTVKTATARRLSPMPLS